MALKDDLKALIIKSGWTMTQVVEELNRKYNRNTSVQNFSSKLKRESLKYTEVEEVLEIIGYTITWNRVQVEVQVQI
ncbi:MAG: LLM class flavin-dependent oxidoreductase [Lachnospiraceae bacterium]